jgi:hypothetical protein
MALATSNTTSNIGIRRMIYTITTPAYRNFEGQGGQLYTVRQGSVNYKGTVYAAGTEIPYDGSSVYTDDATMEQWFNAGIVDPST